MNKNPNIFFQKTLPFSTNPKAYKIFFSWARPQRLGWSLRVSENQTLWNKIWSPESGRWLVAQNFLHRLHVISCHVCSRVQCVNTLRTRQDGRHFPDDIFKCIFLNENVDISIKISLKFVPKCPINNISSLVQIMAWRRPGDKPLSEPVMASLLTHICVTRPQWVNAIRLPGWYCLPGMMMSVWLWTETMSES